MPIRECHHGEGVRERERERGGVGGYSEIVYKLANTLGAYAKPDLLIITLMTGILREHCSLVRVWSHCLTFYSRTTG